MSGEMDADAPVNNGSAPAPTAMCEANVGTCPNKNFATICFPSLVIIISPLQLYHLCLFQSL